jgi:glycosyltransferase involved in cell wall biosynthesis
MTSPDHLASVVLPVFNQADHIDGVVEELDAALTNLLPIRREFILVVNGSTDDSAARCHAIAARYHGVQVIETERKGWGLAVKLGIAASRGDTVCYANSARITARDLVTILRHAVMDDRVVVKATRKIRDSAVRRVGSLLFNLECRALFDLANWDVNGTPKAFPRRFAKLLELDRTDDLIDLEFIVRCRRESYPILEVPIFSKSRRGGLSTTTLLTAVSLYFGCFKMWRELNAEPAQQKREIAGRH